MVLYRNDSPRNHELEVLISDFKKKSHREEVGVSQIQWQEMERGVACDLIPNKTSPGRDFPDW